VTTYDPAIMNTLAAVTPDSALPAMWAQFDAMRNLPLLTIRGANSDLLSTATVAEMMARHPGMAVIEVPDQGHAPLLEDTMTIAAITSFMAACDRR
jgi:pimeloyl-ACP methyl ester carboxylesterase